ncbi:MAG: sensor histidine kinase, partial [Minicystis sp.]
HPVKLRYQASARILRARETDLETAFLNLLDNALRFSPEDKAVEITVRGEAPFVEVSVHDRGPGISPKNLPKIFDRFFTTDSDRNGTGLGLSIVKAVIEAHGGKVAVESEASKGTTFTVKLPVRR